jgi:FKBP-type peptidyl-prolyl cis-trans isomerase
MRRIIIICAGLAVVVAGSTAAMIFVHPALPEAATRAGSINIDPGTNEKGLKIMSDNHAQSAQASPSGTPDLPKSTPSGKAQPNSSGQVPAGSSNVPSTDFSQYAKYQNASEGLEQDITVGTGAEAVDGKRLTMNYRGWLTNGTVFDESYKRGQPFSFTLGAHQVIAGWDAGVKGMRVGGKRRLVLPPSLGYGSADMGVIPPNSVLIFDIELLQVQ